MQEKFEQLANEEFFLSEPDRTALYKKTSSDVGESMIDGKIRLFWPDSSVRLVRFNKSILIKSLS